MSSLIDEPFTRSHLKPVTQADGPWGPHDGDNSWIVDVHGNKLHPLDPLPEEIDIEDIATALSRYPRFGGRTRKFYSVAQHCVLGARMVGADAEHTGDENQLTFLLHDVDEAYFGDIIRPLKVQPIYAEIVARTKSVQANVLRHFGLPEELPAWVHRVDDRMLATEKRDLCPRGGNARWQPRSEPYGFRIDPWLPDEARAQFLLLFRQVTGTLGERRPFVPRQRREDRDA